jgi:hypothetical protein
MVDYKKLIECLENEKRSVVEYNSNDKAQKTAIDKIISTIKEFQRIKNDLKYGKNTHMCHTVPMELFSTFKTDNDNGDYYVTEVYECNRCNRKLIMTGDWFNKNGENIEKIMSAKYSRDCGDSDDQDFDHAWEALNQQLEM